MTVPQSVTKHHKRVEDTPLTEMESQVPTTPRVDRKRPSSPPVTTAKVSKMEVLPHIADNVMQACPHCQKKFKHKSSLSRHVNHNHKVSTRGIISCNECDIR